MDATEFTRQLAALQRPAKRMIFSDSDPGAVPVTKLGGEPWWPRGTPRPKCADGHLMEFMAQVRLSDCADIGTDGLLSFHYCTECMYEGKMSFGHADQRNKGYDVRVFAHPEQSQIDKLGSLTAATIPSRTVQLEEFLEVPSVADMPDDLGRALPDDYHSAGNDYKANIYRGLVHYPLSKLGGWPTWPQNPEWPAAGSNLMKFLFQIDAVIGESTAWGGGGCALLFVGQAADGSYRGEMCLQTT